MTLDADVSAIQKAAADNLQATNQPGRAGAEGYASFALPDAHWMPPDVPAIRGRAAIVDFAAPFTEMKDFAMSWEHPEVRVAESRDIAYSVGTFSGSGRDAEGNLQEFQGQASQHLASATRRLLEDRVGDLEQRPTRWRILARQGLRFSRAHSNRELLLRG